MSILLLVFSNSIDTMPRRSYSKEFKETFIQHRNDGKSLSWISDALKVSFNTLKRWSMKLGQWETLEDKRIRNGKKKTFSDEELKCYITEHVNATLKEIGVYFSVSDVAILKRLEACQYSYKKKRWCIKRGMKIAESNSKKRWRIFQESELYT